MVGSVFKSLGYHVVVTGRSNDGGIDAVLEGASGIRIGVQVKRYRNKIEAEQIRAFTGALVIEGFTRGIYVTTSAFRPGAKRAAEKSEVRGHPISLVDADGFLAALSVAQREFYTSEELDVMLANLLYDRIKRGYVATYKDADSAE